MAADDECDLDAPINAGAAQPRERHMRASSALLSATLVNLLLPAQAHDIYSHLMDRQGHSCCDERDCRPVPYRTTAGGVKMLVNGRWIDVPDHTIQYRALPGDTGETGGGHWCGFVDTPPTEPTKDDLEPVYTTRCAILPPQATEADLERLGIPGR
jgi:hypothetical protein